MFRNLAQSIELYCAAPCPGGICGVNVNGEPVFVAAGSPYTDMKSCSFGTVPPPPPPPPPNCLPHGTISKTGQCCTGLKAWNYDANSGQPYDGFGCWTAQCATLGQWAGPNGQGNYCCPPLVNVAGKCANAVPGGSGSGTAPVGPAVCKGTLICAVPDMYLYLAGGALVLLMFMGGRK